MSSEHMQIINEKVYKKLESMDFGPNVLFGKCADGEHTRTYPLNITVSLQLVDDLKRIQGLNAEEELMNVLVEEFVSEISQDIKRYSGPGSWKFGKIVDFRDVDPVSFQPLVTFKYTLSFE